MLGNHGQVAEQGRSGVGEASRVAREGGAARLGVAVARVVGARGRRPAATSARGRRGEARL